MRWLPAAMSLSVLLSLSLPAAPQGATCPWALSRGKETRAAQALPADGPVQSWWLEFTQGAGDTDAALAPPVEKGPDGPLAVLYRVVNAAGGALSLCLTTDGVPGPSQTLDPSGNWHAASLAAKQPPISGRLALRLSGAAGSVVQLLLPQSPLAPPSPAQALRSLAQHCASSGAHDEAQAAYEGVAALAPGTGEAATALRGAGDSRRAAGATEAAVESYLRALDECGSATDGWQSFPGAQGYSQNREAVDLETALRDRLVEAAGGASPLVAARALRAAALQLPPTPSSRAAALACACASEAAGTDPSPWAVLSLDQSGDHDATRATLRLPENQAHLDAIGKPTDPAALAEALRVLLRCAGESLPDDKLSGAVAAWLAGEQAGLSRDGTACAAQFSLAADLGAGTVVAACARVVLSQWLWYLGLFREAEGALPRAEEAVLPAVRQWRDLHLGRLWAAQGVYASAQEAFGAATAGPSPLLSEHARLLQGECLEFRGLWEDARQLYTALAGEATVPTTRRLAHYWARRVQECSRQYRAAFGTVAHYWGEDRQTQGQWYGYGEEVALHCSREAPGELMTGTAVPVRYRYHTTDPDRGAWPWNWDSVTPHPSLLIDPFLNRPSAANWDDGGEKYAPGTGPDLVVDWTIPKGTYRLSLYMVNDVNYYEPGREYSIYLTDADNAVLAACPVRGFEAGVYHHFVVKGPRQLSIRIFRNLSMNVLLQGIFMDRLDTRTDAMATAATHGPWGELLGRQQPRMGASPSCDFCDATTRRDTVRGLLQRPIEGLLGEWWTYRLLNDYGAGRGYERQALGRVCDTVRSALGAEASAEMWQATSAAQREAGKRASAVLFTRLALDEWRRLDSDLPTRLARLESAIRVMQSDWRYYVGFAGNAKPFETLFPLDEAYSRELADEFIAQARADRTPMQAAADILPLARDLCAQGRELLPCVLFAAVGADNLGSSDLLLYAKAERDPQARLKLTRMAQALNPSTTRSSLSPIDIMLRLARGGDLDGAEAELVRVLADPDVLRFTKANAAYNFAYHLMQIGERTGAAGDRERSIKWFKVVIDQFGDTHFAATAKKCIDRQNQAQ